MQQSDMHKRVEVSTEAFSPRAFQCSVFSQGMQYPKGYRLNPRNVYDYEIELFLDGSGSIIVDGTEFPVRKGDIMLRRPGQRAQGVMPYSCYMICFDLLGNMGKSPEAYNFEKQQEFQENYKNPILDAIPLIYHTAYYDKQFSLFDAAFRGFVEAEEEAELVTKAAIIQILYHIYREVRSQLSDQNLAASAHALEIRRVLQFIRNHYTSRINLEMMAQVANLSPTYFHKIFTEAVGTTPNEFVIQQRMGSARELLLGTSRSIADVAIACGMDNTPYFSYLFKKRNGMSPAEFRRKYSYAG
jgi:AraC family transcriptional regulator